MLSRKLFFGLLNKKTVLGKKKKTETDNLRLSAK